ncbi:MAG: site-specific integrase [Vulcanimicrobiaceae bacterium]
MTLAQIRDFIAAVKGDSMATLYTLAITTGMRQSEILGLRWCDVAADHLAVTGSLAEQSRERAATKTGKHRRVEVPPEVIALLAQHRAAAPRARPHDYVFVNSLGRPMRASILRRAWRATRARLGLSSAVRVYDLRHAHATALLASGVHPKIVQERLGHASIMLTLDTYSHVVPGMQAPALAAISSLFGSSSPQNYPQDGVSEKSEGVKTLI